ncbi:Homebox and aldo/keto reductase domain-containing protein [Globisporangium polare]
MTLPNRPGYRMQCVKTNQSVVTAAAESSAVAREQAFAARQVVCDPAAPSTYPQYAQGQDEAMDETEIERETHHELLPLIHRLKQMIARPDKLLAALVHDDTIDGDYGVGGRATGADERKLLLRKKTVVFQRVELRELANTWHRFVDTVGSPSSTSSYMKRVDHMMMKLALYYMRLWNYLCAICIDAVVAMGVVVHEAHKQWLASLQPDRRRATASISPMFESKSSDALSQNMIRTPSSASALAKRSRLTRQSNEFMIGWFIAHKANPYPSADERAQIADKTGLTEQQVRNWFANMRKRHWKPNRLNTKKPRCLLDVVLRKHEV